MAATIDQFPFLPFIKGQLATGTAYAVIGHRVVAVVAVAVQ